MAKAAQELGQLAPRSQRAADPLRTLALRAADGDGNAIHALVMELGGPMLRTVRKVLGTQHPDAEDVTQEAVLGLLSSLKRFRGDCTVTHFAHRIALRSALHARRHFKVRDRVGDQPLEVEEHRADGTSPLESAISAERRSVVRELLDQLPEPTAEALGLHFVLGQTVDEIAAATETSPHTVWSRLKSGKRALKQAMARHQRLTDLLQERRR